MPYWHGTKKGFAVTWLTKTNFQRGCGGNAAPSAARAPPAPPPSTAATGPAATPRMTARRGNEAATAVALSRERPLMSYPPPSYLVARPACGTRTERNIARKLREVTRQRGGREWWAGRKRHTPGPPRKGS